MAPHTRDGISHGPSLATALVLTGVLATGLAGCGGSSDGRGIPVPPGGVAIGNLVCIDTTMVPPFVIVLQGAQRTITFRLVDVNTAVPGAGIPVAFDVVGGALADPPLVTDAAGFVTVIFTAGADFVGAGRVRLIQPELQLDCDVSFTVFESPIIVTARTKTGGGVPVRAFDACGSVELDVQRTDSRVIVLRARQFDPVSGTFVPVAGIFFHVSATTDLGLIEGAFGPTDAAGEFDLVLPPFPPRRGEVVVSATAIRPDLLGDGIPDPDVGNTCSAKFMLNTMCDANLDVLAPTYHAADGSIKGAPVRPGESATIAAFVLLDGIPQVDYPVLVSPEAGGFVNGSAVPITLVTDAMGKVEVTFTAAPGFPNAINTVTFQSDRGDIVCLQTANIAVATCDWVVEFGTPPVSGGSHLVTLTLLNADSATAVGELVSLDVIGGFFTEQPPYYALVDMGGGVLQVSTTLHITPGFSGASAISASFPGGYPCTTVTKPFVVGP
jgi:hypothetical protein